MDLALSLLPLLSDTSLTMICVRLTLSRPGAGTWEWGRGLQHLLIGISIGENRVPGSATASFEDGARGGRMKRRAVRIQWERYKEVVLSRSGEVLIAHRLYPLLLCWSQYLACILLSTNFTYLVSCAGARKTHRAMYNRRVLSLALASAVTTALPLSCPQTVSSGSGSGSGAPTVYFIRHGEKPSDGGVGLSSEGEDRAECLRNIFGKDSEYKIGQILAMTPKDGMCLSFFFLPFCVCCVST